MSHLDLDALAVALLSEVGNGWLIDVPDGGIGVSFMLGLQRFVMTASRDGIVQLVDEQGAKQPERLVHLVDFLRTKGFDVRDAEGLWEAWRRGNQYIRPDDRPTSRPCSRPNHQHWDQSRGRRR